MPPPGTIRVKVDFFFEVSLEQGFVDRRPRSQRRIFRQNTAGNVPIVEEMRVSRRRLCAVKVNPKRLADVRKGRRAAFSLKTLTTVEGEAGSCCRRCRRRRCCCCCCCPKYICSTDPLREGGWLLFANPSTSGEATAAG